VLLHVKRHSSGRTTFQGEDQFESKSSNLHFSGSVRCDQLLRSIPLFGEEVSDARRGLPRTVCSTCAATSPKTIMALPRAIRLPAPLDQYNFYLVSCAWQDSAPAAKIAG